MTSRFVEVVCNFDQVVPEIGRHKNTSPTMQSEVETYLDRNIWSSLTSNISNGDYTTKDIIPDSRDIINFVDTSILIDTREGIHGEMGIGVGGHLHHVSGHIKDEMSGYHHSQESHHEHHSSSPPLHMSKGSSLSLWDMDINSSIQKLDPMHVEVSTFITNNGREDDCDDVIKQEYLADDTHLYVNSAGGYQGTVFELPPPEQNPTNCDPNQSYTYTISCSATGQIHDTNVGAIKYDPGYRHNDMSDQVNYNQVTVSTMSHSHPHDIARHTPPPPYNNTQYNSSFSPCSSSSSSLSPPIAATTVSTRSEISTSTPPVKINRRNNPELEKRRTHHCDFPGCTKVYTKSSHLKAHQRIHTGNIES